MDESLATLMKHGYAWLFGAVLVEQMGLPLPSVPLLVAAGALVGLGHLGPIGVLGAVLTASLLADLAWYELGRRQGRRVLGFLCKMALEPEVCVRVTEGVFERWGLKCLLFAKFVPGLYTVTPPVAGLVGIKRGRFALWDSVGITIWAGTYTGLGYLLRYQLEDLMDIIETWGTSLFQLVLAVIGIHLIYKFVRRRQFLGRLRLARISAQELKEMLDSGQQVMIADLRHSTNIQSDPFVIPGAHVLTIDSLSERHQELPRDREIVLYCT